MKKVSRIIQCSMNQLKTYKREQSDNLLDVNVDVHFLLSLVEVRSR